MQMQPQKIVPHMLSSWNWWNKLARQTSSVAQEKRLEENGDSPSRRTSKAPQNCGKFEAWKTQILYSKG